MSGMKVKATWEFEVDMEDLNPKCIHVNDLAKDLAKRELDSLIANRDIAADDFEYEVVKE